jgi:hypothetical protein
MSAQLLIIEPRSMEPARRKFMLQSASFLGLAALGAPAIVAAQSTRPTLPYGLQLGDPTLAITGRRGFGNVDMPDLDELAREFSRGGGFGGLEARTVLWARSDKPARMVV